MADMEAGDRHVASGQKWHEDLQWGKRLDQGWNLSAVKQVSLGHSHTGKDRCQQANAKLHVCNTGRDLFVAHRPQHMLEASSYQADSHQYQQKQMAAYKLAAYKPAPPGLSPAACRNSAKPVRMQPC